MSKLWKILKGILIGIAALVLVLVIAFQIVLRPSVLTSLVNKYVPQFVEGDVHFSGIKASIVKSFPFASIEAKDLTITYPHERYARFDSLYQDSGRRFSMLKAGNARDGSGVDTLASARRLYASLNYMSLLKNKISVHAVELEKARVFLHYFDSTTSNLDIFPLGGDKEEKDTTKSSMTVDLHNIHLRERPLVVYTNPADTLLLRLRAISVDLDGKLPISDIWKTDANLSADTLRVSGRLPADTLAVNLQRLRAGLHKRHVTLDADARARLRTNSFGHLNLPIHLDADALIPKVPEGQFAVKAKSLTAKVSSLELKADGDFLSRPGAMDMDVNAAIEDCPIGDLMKEFRENLPVLKKIDTDAHLSLDAHAKGTYADSTMPAINASLLIPPATVDIQGVGRKGRLELDADAVTDKDMVLDATVNKLYANIAGAKVDLSGSGKDILGNDPSLALDGTLRARIDSLMNIFMDDMTGSGVISGKLHGKALLSQVTDLSKIGNADINCDLTGSDVRVDSDADSLHAYIGTLDLNLATKSNTINKDLRKGARVLALKAGIDTVNVTYLDDIYLRGSDIKLLAQNSDKILQGGKQLTPLMGLLKVGRAHLKDMDGMAVGLMNNSEKFKIIPSKKDGTTLTLTSESGGILAKLDDATVFLLDNLTANVSARQKVRSSANKERRNHILDSLQRVYPGTPRDSLFRKARMEKEAAKLKDDFASRDVMLSLSKSSQQMAKQWDFGGDLNLEKVHVKMDALPIKTEVSDVRGNFTSDKVDLENVTVNAGQSDLSARATVSGIHRLLTGRGKPYIIADAALTSEYINANELMRALAYYTNYNAPEDGSEPEEVPDTASIKTDLIVLPSNVEANLTLESTGIRYDSLLVTWAAADIAMRDRTLQITNALAASNMGDLYVEGFYATRAKDDIKAGVDLNIVDISAEKVLTLLPSVKENMPIMESFSGDLDMEVAATTEIDTTMSLILPSVDGIMRFTGSQLSLKDSKEFTKIAKLLLFKDNSKAVIDNMSVTGMVRSNTLEVFPFILDVDRYMLAASGIQNLDESFNYHISVIRSPLLVKFGLNAWGTDFDHIKYGLGKAKYTNPNVPVFTKQLDTVQYNLVAAIHNVFELGVEKAMAENTGQNYIQNRKDALAFSEAVDTTAMDEVVMASIENMDAIIGDVAERVSERRDALREEVLYLEEKSAAIKEDEQ